MRFVRALYGGDGDARGLKEPWGLTFVRGLLVVSEFGGAHLRVFTRAGALLQVMPLGTSLSGLCASEERMWAADSDGHVVYVMPLRGCSLPLGGRRTGRRSESCAQS